MEKKNMVLLTVIAVATLLVAVVGATFAYFTANVTNTFNQGDGGNGKTNIETSKIASQTVIANIENEAGKFTATDVYPGHKEIAAVKVTVTGEEDSESAIAIKYKVTTNDLYDDATITVYGLESPLSIPNTDSTSSYFNCQKKTKVKTGDEDKTGQEQTILYYEDCEKKDTELPIGKKIGDTKQIPQTGGQELVFNDTITASSSGTTKYYYVVIEFENNDNDQENQNSMMSKTLDGQITVETA